MTEFVEVGEESGGDLQRVEVKEEVKRIQGIVGVVGASWAGGSAGFQPLQAGT